MPAAPATTDAFTAIAEPRRRRLLSALAKGAGQRSVNDIAGDLGWPQPQVSKHLAVLRHAGLVRVHRAGRRSLYSVNARELKPVHDWVKTFERFWEQHLDRIKQRAEQAAAKPAAAKDHE